MQAGPRALIELAKCKQHGHCMVPNYGKKDKLCRAAQTLHYHFALLFQSPSAPATAAAGERRRRPARRARSAAATPGCTARAAPPGTGAGRPAPGRPPKQARQAGVQMPGMLPAEDQGLRQAERGWGGPGLPGQEPLNLTPQQCVLVSQMRRHRPPAPLERHSQAPGVPGRPAGAPIRARPAGARACRATGRPAPAARGRPSLALPRLAPATRGQPGLLQAQQCR